jgi:hypothetical protein
MFESENRTSKLGGDECTHHFDHRKLKKPPVFFSRLQQTNLPIKHLSQILTTFRVKKKRVCVCVR